MLCQKQEKYEQSHPRRTCSGRLTLATAHNDEACAHLASALKDLKRLDDAAVWYQQAVRLNPQSPEYQNNLGVALHQRGRLTDAAESYQRAIQLKPQYAEAHNNLGVTLKELRRSAEAVAYLQQALKLKADYVDAYNNHKGPYLASGEHESHGRGPGRTHQAALSTSIQIPPQAYNNQGVVLNSLGRNAEAVASYRRALEASPEFAEAHSNLCLTLNYDPRIDDATLLAEHRRFAEMQTHPQAGE